MPNNSEENKLDNSIADILDKLVKFGMDLEKIMPLYIKYGGNKTLFHNNLTGIIDGMELSKKKKEKNKSKDDTIIVSSLKELARQGQDIGIYLAQYNGFKEELIITLNSALNELKQTGKKKK